MQVERWAPMNQFTTRSRRKPRVRVEVGQVWQIASPRGDRCEYRIDMLAGNVAVCSALPSGRSCNFAVSTLTHRRRCAKLLRNADGSEAIPDHEPELRVDTPAERRTAGDLRKTRPAKHCKAPGEETRRTYELQQQGLSYQDIADRMRTSVPTVAARLKVWRDWMVDENNRRAMGDA